MQFKCKKKFFGLLETILLAAGLCIPNANAGMQIQNVYLSSSVNGKESTPNHKEALLVDDVKICLNAEIKSEGKLIRTNIPLEDSFVEWYKIEPTRNAYSNVHKQGGRTFFRIDRPEYQETLISRGSDWSIDADAKPTSLENLRKNPMGCGVMRFMAKLFFRGKIYATPGKESLNTLGISKKVHAISFRRDNSFLGWLTNFFNVPYIYGSTGIGKDGMIEHQTENLVGTDCADFVVGAARKAGIKIPYTNAAGLGKYSEEIINYSDISIDSEGDFLKKGRPIVIGIDAQIGDLILFHNKLGYWHVGVLAKDRSDPESPSRGNPDGVLGVYDAMIESFLDVPKDGTIGYRKMSIFRLKPQKAIIPR